LKNQKKFKIVGFLITSKT